MHYVHIYNNGQIKILASKYFHEDSFIASLYNIGCKKMLTICISRFALQNVFCQRNRNIWVVLYIVTSGISVKNIFYRNLNNRIILLNSLGEVQTKALNKDNWIVPKCKVEKILAFRY